MNFNADVLLCLQNIEICIHKLKQLGLLNRDQRCPNCQEMCFWTKYSKSKDGWAWKCQTKLCQNYKNYISIRKGSFFANSNIPLPKWLHLMYLWATKASNSFLIEITMLLIILLGISIYSTNFELFSAVSVWGGEILHLIRNVYQFWTEFKFQHRIPFVERVKMILPTWVFSVSSHPPPPQPY